MTGERDTATRAKELLVYGPIGLALYVRDTAPSFLKLFVARGRTEVEQRRRDVGDQIGQVRVTGESMAAAGGPQVLRIVADGLSAVRERAEEALEALGVRPHDDDDERLADRDGSEDWSAASTAPNGPSAVRTAPPELAIADYDDLSASQVVDRLDGLSHSDLEAIRAHEAAHRARNTILGKIEQLTRGF